MNDTFLHLSIDPDSQVNQPALTEALKGYQFIEYFNGNYLIQTDVAPDVIQGQLRSALGDTDVILFAVHRDQFDDAILPDDVQTWFSSRKAA